MKNYETKNYENHLFSEILNKNSVQIKHLDRNWTQFTELNALLLLAT